MNEKEYLKLKLGLRGFYGKFNTLVLKWHMRDMFNPYVELLETAKDYDNFEDYYERHTKGKEVLIDETVEKMFTEACKKIPTGIRFTKKDCKDAITVRLGNIWTGMYTENKIINTLNSLSDWITCEKTDADTDTNYKVDAIVGIPGIDNFAVQIKPISFLTYGKGTEKEHHERYELEIGNKVLYLFYKDDKDTIVFNEETFSLEEDTLELKNFIENTIYYL